MRSEFLELRLEGGISGPNGERADTKTNTNNNESSTQPRHYFSSSAYPTHEHTPKMEYFVHDNNMNKTLSTDGNELTTSQDKQE